RANNSAVSSADRMALLSSVGTKIVFIVMVAFHGALPSGRRLNPTTPLERLCITANLSGRCLLMGWSGRAPAPPVTNLARGSKDKGARHVPEPQQRNRRDRHRYRQKLIPCRRAG